MFQIAQRTLLFDLNMGTKQRTVIAAMATIKNIIAVLTLSNMPTKSMFWNALVSPPNPIAKYAMITMISRIGITQDRRPFVSFFTSVLLII